MTSRFRTESGSVDDLGPRWSWMFSEDAARRHTEPLELLAQLRKQVLSVKPEAADHVSERSSFKGGGGGHVVPPASCLPAVELPRRWQRFTGRSLTPLCRPPTQTTAYAELILCSRSSTLYVDPFIFAGMLTKET